MPSGLKFERHRFGREQRLILLGEAGVGVGEDLLEVGDVKRVELDPDRKASLQLGNQVRGLGRGETRRSR